MTDAITVAIVGSIAPTLLALAAFVQSLRNGSKIAEVHQATNGQHTALTAEVHAVAAKLDAANTRIGQQDVALATATERIAGQREARALAQQAPSQSDRGTDTAG